MKHSLLLDDGAKWCALALRYAALLTAGTPERAACFEDEQLLRCVAQPFGNLPTSSKGP